jgi:dihydroorotate dehydrogenase (NAD+) catalytic subunit
MVWEVYQKAKIPLIGMGGIMNTEDGLEFLIAGASAIAIGTLNFVNPGSSVQIIEGLKKYMAKLKINDIKDIVGSLKT